MAAQPQTVGCLKQGHYPFLHRLESLAGVPGQHLSATQYAVQTLVCPFSLTYSASTAWPEHSYLTFGPYMPVASAPPVVQAPASAPATQRASCASRRPTTRSTLQRACTRTTPRRATRRRWTRCGSWRRTRAAPPSARRAWTSTATSRHSPCRWVGADVLCAGEARQTCRVTACSGGTGHGCHDHLRPYETLLPFACIGGDW